MEIQRDFYFKDVRYMIAYSKSISYLKVSSFYTVYFDHIRMSKVVQCIILEFQKIHCSALPGRNIVKMHLVVVGGNTIIR